MSRVTIHLDDGADLDIDAEAIQPGARFIVQMDAGLSPEQLDAFRTQLIEHIGPDVAFIVVSGAKIIPIPPAVQP